MKTFLILFILGVLVSCGKDGKNGANGLNGADGLDGQDAVVQQETLWLSNGSSCSTSGLQLPSMLPELCFTYANPALRIHPQNGSICDTSVVLYTQNITTTAIGTPIVVPETGTSFSASAVNESNTILFLSRNSGCGNVRAVEFAD